MEITINDLRLANTCPILPGQSQLYHAVTERSRILFDEIGRIFNNVLYQSMRGRKLNPRRVNQYWKQSVDAVAEKFPNLTDQEVLFPAQCLAIFMDTYMNTPPEEVVGPSVPFEVPVSSDVIVRDAYPLLTRTNFGTRITVFEFRPKSFPEIHYANDFFYTIYAHAYRREFEKKEFAVRVHNLGDGKFFDLLRSDAQMEKHLGYLEAVANTLRDDRKAPALSQCPACPIASTCHVERYAGH